MEGGGLITILSIDGGGVRGIIPAVILKSLEDELQKLEGEEVRVANYFDVIAGTSAGALITAMLTAPNPHDEQGRPCSAQQIIEFYYSKGPSIFKEELTQDEYVGELTQKETNSPPSSSPTANESIFYTVWKALSQFFSNSFSNKFWNMLDRFLKAVMEPRHDGGNLALEAEDLGRETRLKDTVTNVVIPTYDVRGLQPLIFTTRLAKKKKSDIKLADVAVASASAPYYFPPKELKVDDEPNMKLVDGCIPPKELKVDDKPNVKLVDGGIVANNPTLLAIEEATKLFREKSSSHGPPDYSKYLILSLGTGKEKITDGYPIKNGGIAEWILPSVTSPPLLDVLFRASDDVVDRTTSFILGEHNSTENYLRIQDCELPHELGVINNASEDHLNKLRNIWEGDEGLKNKRVAIPDSETGLRRLSAEAEQPTNQCQLQRFAEKLYNERKSRRGYYNK